MSDERDQVGELEDVARVVTPAPSNVLVNAGFDVGRPRLSQRINDARRRCKALHGKALCFCCARELVLDCNVGLREDAKVWKRRALLAERRVEELLFDPEWTEIGGEG